MSTSSRPASAVRVLSSSGRGASHLRASAALLLVLALAACATLAPGAREVVVRTEQTLKISTAIYDSGLDWCRANAGVLSPGMLTVVNRVRTGFPIVYRGADSLLDSYKAGQAAEAALNAKVSEVEALATELATTVSVAGGPDLKAAAIAKNGGK